MKKCTQKRDKNSRNRWVCGWENALSDARRIRNVTFPLEIYFRLLSALNKTLLGIAKYSSYTIYGGIQFNR